MTFFTRLIVGIFATAFLLEQPLTCQTGAQGAEQSQMQASMSQALSKYYADGGLRVSDANVKLHVDSASSIGEYLGDKKAFKLDRAAQDSLQSVTTIVLPTDKEVDVTNLQISTTSPSSAPTTLGSSDLEKLLHYRDLTQQVVMDSFRPMPILNGVIPPASGQTPEIAALLTDENRAELSRMAQSVGRIELSGDLLGTAFVISPGVLATNCHVLEEMGRKTRDGSAFVLTKDGTLVVDFSDLPDHDPSHEFLITDIVGYSNQSGFDVALLRVSEKSRDGSSPIPPPLPTGSYDGTKVKIGIIGYPDLSRAFGTKKTIKMFERLVRMNGQTVTKILSTGLAVHLAGTSNYIMEHYASTQGGQSGSPVINLSTRRVIGVHFCCTGLETRTAGDLACGTWTTLNVSTNEAITSDSIFQDTVLRANLPPR